MPTIDSVEQLEALYGSPRETSVVKVLPRLSPEYRHFVERSPFVALATSGPEGLDCSPRGDLPGFVRVRDDATLLMPDRRGNNRVDSLRNLVLNPRAALLFLVPGIGSALRVNGRARLDVTPELLESFEVGGQAPRSVIVLSIDAVYFQCARAILRAELWNPERHADPKSVPSPGQMLAAITEGRLGGPSYDDGWEERARKDLW